MTIIYVGIAWLVGLGLGAVLEGPNWFWIALGCGALVMALLFHRRPPFGLWLLMVGALCLGTARYPSTASETNANQIALYNGRDEVSLTGIVIEEPRVSDSGQQLVLKAENLSLPDSQQHPVEGRILLRTGRYPSIPYGARLQVEGQLEGPPGNPEFNQQEYWARQGIFSQVIPFQVKILSEGNGNPIKNGIYSIKDRARQTIRNMLPDPEAALVTGILLGDDSGIPKDLAEQFRATGLTHIIAISGFKEMMLDCL